jgi:hypothetical protein
LILPGEVPALNRYQLDLTAKGNRRLVLVWHQVRKETTGHEFQVAIFPF